MTHLLVVMVLERALNRHMVVLWVSNDFFEAELEGLPGHAKVLNVVIFESELLMVRIFGVIERLYLDGVIYGHAGAVRGTCAALVAATLGHLFLH